MLLKSLRDIIEESGCTCSTDIAVKEDPAKVCVYCRLAEVYKAYVLEEDVRDYDCR
jgi:hypothetical protein